MVPVYAAGIRISAITEIANTNQAERSLIDIIKATIKNVLRGKTK